MVWKLILASDGSNVTWSNTSSFNCIWKGLVLLTQCWGLLQLLPISRLPLYTLGPTNRAFCSKSKPPQQAHVGGMKSVWREYLNGGKWQVPPIWAFSFREPF